MKVRLVDIESRLDITPNKQEGVLNFDKDNSYTQRIRRLTNSSPRAQQCIKTFRRFIRAAGFKDETFFKAKVSLTLTMDKLLRAVTDDYALHNGFAIHLNYNALGKIVSMTHIPFEELRIAINEDGKVIKKLKHHTDWARERCKQIKKEEIVTYDLYNPNPEEILKQAIAVGGFNRWNGQIFWYSPLGFKYPLATCDSVLPSIVADAASQEFHLNNITTNFMASHFLITGEHENANDEREFDDTLKRFQGAKGVGKIMKITKKHADQPFEIKKVDIQDMDGLYDSTEKSVEKKISSNYMLLPVLVGDLVAGKMGTAQELQDAYAWYNSITVDDRMIFEETFAELGRNFYKNINPTNDYSIIPLSFVAAADPGTNPGQTIIT